MNEFDFLKKNLDDFTDTSIQVGVGDDCSVIDLGNGRNLVQCCDALIEDVHFRLSYFSMEELAHKVLAVNISDIAAMGAVPRFAHLVVGKPDHLSEEHLSLFFRTLRDLCKQHSISMIGGDLCKSPSHLFLSLHLTGECVGADPLLRSGLSDPGVLCVTGYLGDSSAGLYCLENSLDIGGVLKEVNKRPLINWEWGHWLAKSGLVQGMMDLSDGLASDLHHIKSELDIHLDAIPLSDSLVEFCESQNLYPFDFAIGGGEDYQLLLNCKESDLEKLKHGFLSQFSQELFPIGKVTPGKKSITYWLSGVKQDNTWKHFQHF